jgi:RsiW-degrading membrane proteinase PrsW (M82 family)
MPTTKVLVILGASFVPSMLWFVYFMKTRGERHLKMGLAMLMAGMVAAPIAYLAFSLMEMNPFYAQIGDVSQASEVEKFAFSLFAIGPIEEMAKFTAVWGVITALKLKLTSLRSALLWSTAAALGFATLENWYYMLEVQDVVWHRALTLPFNHVLFSSFWGVGFYRYTQSGGHRRWLISTLVLAFVYHGLYDYILLSDAINPLFVLPIVMLLYFFLTVNFRRAREEASATEGGQRLEAGVS